MPKMHQRMDGMKDMLYISVILYPANESSMQYEEIIQYISVDGLYDPDFLQ